jgi:hypothetical protein
MGSSAAGAAASAASAAAALFWGATKKSDISFTVAITSAATARQEERRSDWAGPRAGRRLRAQPRGGRGTRRCPLTTSSGEACVRPSIKMWRHFCCSSSVMQRLGAQQPTSLEWADRQIQLQHDAAVNVHAAFWAAANAHAWCPCISRPPRGLGMMRATSSHSRTRHGAPAVHRHLRPGLRRCARAGAVRRPRRRPERVSRQRSRIGRRLPRLLRR